MGIRKTGTKNNQESSRPKNKEPSSKAMSKKVSSKMKMMKKVAEKTIITDKLKTIIPSGKAMPGPPLGPLLGQRGINIAAFCKDFNNRTSIYREGIPLPVRVKVNPDRSYDLTIHNPTSSYFLLQAAGIQRGSMQPGKEIVGKVTIKHIYEIAKIKGQDHNLQLTPMKQMCEMLIKTAYQMGIEVVHDLKAEEYGEFLEQQKQVVAEQLKKIWEDKEAKLLRK